MRSFAIVLAAAYLLVRLLPGQGGFCVTGQCNDSYALLQISCAHDDVKLDSCSSCCGTASSDAQAEAGIGDCCRPLDQAIDDHPPLLLAELTVAALDVGTVPAYACMPSLLGQTGLQHGRPFVEPDRPRQIWPHYRYTRLLI